MNNGDAYNKGVIKICLRTSLKEVVMSMMFTKTVLFLTVTQTFITSCTIPHSLTMTTRILTQTFIWT